MVLEVNEITKLYKNKRGIKNISFTIEKGEVFGLLGSNGSGKTTIMKVITGLVKPKSGYIKIFGKDIEENKSLFQVGCLIESPSFISYMTAKQNLESVRKFYGGNASNIDEILQTVGLSQYADDHISSFSLGMKQRLGLAIALMGNPNFLILDEPSNALDIEGIVEIRNLILQLSKNKNVTFLISSHLSVEIEKMCTKVGIMHEGNLIVVENMTYILSNFSSLEDYFLHVMQIKREAKMEV